MWFLGVAKGSLQSNFDLISWGTNLGINKSNQEVSLSKNINPSLVLVQPRKTRPFITERLLMGRKESNQTNKQTKQPGRPVPL